MALPTWYDTGTVSVANGSASVAGTGTLWGGDAIMAGDLFCDLAQPLVPPQRIASVEANGGLTLAAPWPGTSLTDDAYEIRYVGIIERSTAQTRLVLEQLGEVSAYFDIQVDDTAARLALETVDAPLRANYRVLVSDIGDGTAAIYSKASGAYGNWTDPAPYSGPVGPIGATGPAGVDWQGTYGAGTAYVLNDGVLYNGSSWRALQATTGNAPPTLPTTSNAYWELIARQGTDGAGTVSSVVAGAGAAVDNTDPTAPVVSVSNDLLITVSLLALQVADNTNVALFLGDAGNRVADSFDALTYVDVAGATNLDTSAAGILKPTLPAVTSTLSQALNADATFAAITLKSRLAAAIITASGSYVRVKLDGPAAGTPAAYSNVFIGHVATSGDAWDYDGTQVRLTFSGSSSVTPPVGGSVWSDWVAYALDETKSLIVGVDKGATSQASRYRTGLGGNFNVYYKASVAEAGLTDGTGYSTEAGSVYAVSDIEVTSSLVANNMTVRSAAFTALSVPSKMKALIRVKEVDAATAGTDYTVECSRDGGTTWAAMTLTELFTSPSPTASIRVVNAAETVVSGQPSGTAPRWRFKTLNNKNVELHDAYLYWD